MKQRDAVVFAWFVPVEMPELGEYYLRLLQTYHRDSKLFIGMNHDSDRIWEGRIRQSGLDAEVRWARQEIGDYWDATGFLTALEIFHDHQERFALVWFGHTKGASKSVGDDEHIRSVLHDSFWARGSDVARAFADPTVGLFAPRYNLTPPYPFPGPWTGWTNELAALQRVYRDPHSPLGLCALDTFFVLRGQIVRRFCDSVSQGFFLTDPGAYGANKWFFEMAFPSIAAMQGFEPFIDIDVPGEDDPRDDLMVSGDVKQTHRLAGAEVARWRLNPVAFEPRIIPWDRPAWGQPPANQEASPTEAEPVMTPAGVVGPIVDADRREGEPESSDGWLQKRPGLSRSTSHHLEARGWQVLLGERTLRPLLNAGDHSLRVVFRNRPRDSYRIRLAFTLQGMEILRIGLHSATRGGEWRVRNVWLDVARPGTVHHELEWVALYSNPSLAFFELELDGVLAPDEEFHEISLVPVGADMSDLAPDPSMAIELLRGEVEQIPEVSDISRFFPQPFADREVPQRRYGLPRTAVVFAWFVPETMPDLGEYYLNLLHHHHVSSKVFIGMNHGSDPTWENLIRESGLDAEVRWARPEIEDYWDTTGFLTGLEAYAQSSDRFDLIWFGHTKGGSKSEFGEYSKTRFALERDFWARGERIATIFADPRIGIFAPRFCPLPTGFFGDELSALLRIYRGQFAPVGLHAKETFFVIREEIVRKFCQSVDGEFFRTSPGSYGAGRYFFEVGFPNIATMEGYEPFIDPDVSGENHPRDDVWLSFDPRQNHRLAGTELERWKNDPMRFEPRAVRELWDPTRP